MPISSEEWRDGSERSREPPSAKAGPYGTIYEFLEEHPEQGFTLVEITENVDLPVGAAVGGSNASSSSSSSVVTTITSAVAGAGKKRVVRYFLNQLVAEGHVETTIVVRSGTEKLYYRRSESSE